MTRVTVNQNFVLPLWSTLKNNLVHNLHNMKHILMVRNLQILPIEIVVLNACIHYLFRRVREACPRNDAVATVRMLSRLFQVDDGHDLFLFELLNDIVLVYQAVGQALRSDEQPGDALRVQAHDERWLCWTLAPVFMLAPLAHAGQRAVELGHLVEIPRLDLRTTILLKLSWRIMLYIEM